MFLWDGVCEFVAVAENESFTAAAKQLGISTAQVSRQVSAIEERLKVKLFYRTTRKVTLSESGNVYYQHCRHVLDGLVEAEQVVTNLHDNLRGKIRITAPITYGEEVIAPILNDFLVKYPEIEIDLNLSNQREDLLEDGYDLAIRLGHLPDSRLIAKKLTNRYLSLCGSDTYLKEYGVPKRLSDLQNHNCILGTAERWRFLNEQKNVFLKVKGRLKCNSGHALVDAALKHLGLVQLPNYYVNAHLKTGVLISVLDQFQDIDEGIWAVYPDKKYPPLKIKVLIDFMQTQIS